MSKTFMLEYSLDNATLEEAIFQADDAYDAEEQLEQFLGTAEYDLVTVEEMAE